MFEDFLKDIAAAYKEQKALYDEHYKRGDFFNVFNILGLRSNETRTHSAFLAELLNPHGSHGMGDSYLKSFISCMHLEDLQLDLQHAYVEVERSIGEIDENYDNGGRIDIIVVSDDKAIIIENKIYAQDQYKQLVRYNNYAKGTFSAYRLLYLTLDKDAASDASTQADDEQLLPNIDYYPITYRSDIIPWLDVCVSNSPENSPVEVIINQYKNLLKELTNTMEENKIVLNVLANEKNWAYMLEILKNGDSWKNEIWNAFVQLLKERVEAKGWILDNNGLGDMSVYTHSEAEYFISITKAGGGAYIGITCETEKSPQKCLPCLNCASEPFWPFGWKWLERDYRYFLPQSDLNSFEYLFPDYRQIFIDYLMGEISTIMSEAKEAGIDL